MFTLSLAQLTLVVDVVCGPAPMATEALSSVILLTSQCYFFCKIIVIIHRQLFCLLRKRLHYNLTVWPESLGPKTPKGNLKTPKKNTTLKTRKHHGFGYKNTKYLIKSFKNGPPKHFYCIFVHQFLKNFNFFY